MICARLYKAQRANQASNHNRIKLHRFKNRNATVKFKVIQYTCIYNNLYYILHINADILL